MTRREWIAGAAAMAAASAAPPRSRMGLATTCYMTVRRFRDTLEFLEHCDARGAGGIQAALASTSPDYLGKLRAGLDKSGMFLEVMIGLPKAGGEEAFEATIQAAKQAGALCARAACLGGRRYETFATLAEWKRFVQESHAGVDRALRICERHKVKFALENHKDWTAEEFVALLKSRSSEYLGVCIDTGNNLSLLDDPYELVEALAPYAFSTHIKDMGVAPFEDGFLLSEMPLGEGFLDLQRMIGTIRAKRPEVKMTLEMITRDPLKVTCLTEKYWATFPDRNGRYLARTLAMVNRNTRKTPLPTIGHLDREAQLRLEDDNVKQCLTYARERLGL